MRYTGTRQSHRYLGGVSALFFGVPLCIQPSQLIAVPAEHQKTPTVADIRRDVRAGKPSQRPVLDWELIEGNPISEKNPSGLTPFCFAVVGRHPSIVRFLKENNARGNGEPNHDRAVLWFATRLEDKDKAYSIVDILLWRSANVNGASGTSVLDSTPLVDAVRASLDMRELGLPFSQNPPLHTPSKGSSATVDAKFLKNKHYMKTLKKPDRALSPTAFRTYIVKSLNSLFAEIINYFSGNTLSLNSLLAHIVQIINYFTGDAFSRLLGLAGSSGDSSGDFARAPKSEVLAGQQFDLLEFDKEITGHIASAGLNKFFLADSKFLQTVVRKATILAESGCAVSSGDFAKTPKVYPCPHAGYRVLTWAHSSQSEVLAAKEFGPAKFDKEITGHVTSAGPNKPSPVESESLQAEVRKATILAESGTASSEDFAVTARASQWYRVLTWAQSPQSPQSPVLTAQQFDPLKFDKEITGHITNVGLNKLSPAESESLQTEARKAVIWAESRKTASHRDSGVTVRASQWYRVLKWAHSSQSEVLTAQQFDPARPDKEITGHITSVGLNKRFPADSKFLQMVMRKATILTESGTTASSGNSSNAPKKSEVLVAQQFDPAKLDNEITGHITSVGLNEFFPAESKSLQAVVRKAAILAESGTTALARPEHLPGLARLSLYQHILFCDNSGSMNTSDRIDSMIEVTKGITEIASYLVPDDEGLQIKFLNTNDTERGLYDRYGIVKTASDAAEMVSQARYDGITMLGTILKEVVLEPYVYQHLNQNQKLEKPLLISIITDGCPYGEDEDKLKQVIIECKQKLQEKNYDLGAVNFQIHQIGNDLNAKAFLDDLRTDNEIKQHIFCSSQKLDEKYKELRDNKEELEIWVRFMSNYKQMNTELSGA